jgi:sugar phosphate isomerase/epimerase
MELGVFESVFERSSLAATFEAVALAGFTCVQFDFQSAGIDPWTGNIDDDLVSEIRRAADAASIRIPAVSGTFNMAHPDSDVRAHGLRGFEQVASRAGALGASYVTLCTGTRATPSMWEFHCDNSTPGAWSEMVDSVLAAVAVAERYDLTVVIEPEPANIVSSAMKARQLLDELADDRLKIVLDPANIVLSDRTREPHVVLSESFALLGPEIALAHAKDVGDDSEFCAAGSGIVPWELYRQLLEGIGYDGDVIFHTLTEDDVPRAMATMRPNAIQGRQQ